MRTYFVLSLIALFGFSAGICDAKDKKQKKPVQPLYLHSGPARIKPVFDKPTFDRHDRVRPTFEKSTIEKRAVIKRGIERPVFVDDKHDRPKWDRSVMETRWEHDTEKVMVPAPVELKSDSKVKRGWFRDLRKP